MMRVYGSACLLLSAFLLGCQEDAPPVSEAPPAPVAIGGRFDAATVGSIEGRVRWQGAAPTVAPFKVPPLQFGLTGPHDRLQFENPQVPRVDGSREGVADAVVFLRTIDPELARPWDQAPVEVEQRDFRLNVRQGSAVSRVGFVRRGDAIRMISRQAVFHSLHADGAAFFTLAFADADRPCCRTMKDHGLVELTSAANYFWMRAYLFVVDHPYYCRTDASGRFVLPAVPSGEYELVCWLPNWKEDRHDRDPESGVIVRLYFQPPMERARKVKVDAGTKATVEFVISAGMFEP